MPIFPIGTDVRPRTPPVGNYLLIALNVLIYLFTDVFGSATGQHLKTQWTLYAAVPDLAQYITYQFLHGDVWHLAGNMLFLWIFGNAVCDRMGSVCYVLFYLAGGIAAGVVFAANNDTGLLGASGSIAAVTTAFLVLYPRVRITMLFWMLILTPFQVPAIYVILFKMVLWDNVIAPSFDRPGVSNVAHSAHLGGYAFGFLVALIMVLVGALPRNQFDLLALVNRWRRRTGLVPATAAPRARPITVEEMGSRPLETLPVTATEKLRGAILDRLEERDIEQATDLYCELHGVDPSQVLPRPAQLEVANYLAQTQRHAEAAATYEAFLRAYPSSPDTHQVRLLLGLLYGRYLGQPEQAAMHLRSALDGLTLPAQRALAEAELRHVEPSGGGS